VTIYIVSDNLLELISNYKKFDIELLCEMAAQHKMFVANNGCFGMCLKYNSYFFYLFREV